jgi:hypothetical protein
MIVAGNSCTQWHAKTNEGSGNLRVTDDGVVLRARDCDQEHRSDLEATSIIYGPRPASVFTPPEDFRKLDIAPLQGKPADPGKGVRKPG